MQLGELAGPHWDGWTITEQKIFAPEWRQGLSPGDIRALPYLHALVAQHRRDADTAKAALIESERLFFALERTCAFYRRQLVLESRLGLCLARLHP